MGGGNGTRGRARAGGDEATRGEATPLLIGRTTFTTSNEHRTDVDKKAKIWALTLLAVLVVIFDFGTYLSAAPQIQIFEQIACDRYYRHAGIQAPLQNGTTRPHHPIADTGNIRGPGALDNSTWKDCTIDPVQNEVALVTQLLNTFDQIPSILLAVPFGILADRIGRRPVLLLSIAGGLLEDIFTKLICWFPTVLPLRLVWLTPVLRVLGGGDGVAGSMLFTMVADLFPEDERAEAFYILTAAVLLSDITASPLSAALMQKSPWLPWLIASGLFIVGVIVTVFLLPETLPPTNRGSRDEELAEGSVKGSVAQRLIAFAKTVSKLTSFMFQTSSVSLLLLSFFVASLARQSTAFQLQYVHKRFGWSYARVRVHVIR